MFLCLSLDCSGPNRGGCKLQGTVVSPTHPLLRLRVTFWPLMQEYRLRLEVHFPFTEESNTADHQNTTRPLTLFAAEWSVSPIALAFDRAIILAHANCTLFRKRRTQRTTAGKTILFEHLQHT